MNSLPVEELLPALISGGGAFLILLTSVGSRLRSTPGSQRTNELEDH